MEWMDFSRGAAPDRYAFEGEPRRVGRGWVTGRTYCCTCTFHASLREPPSSPLSRSLEDVRLNGRLGQKECVRDVRLL